MDRPVQTTIAEIESLDLSVSWTSIAGFRIAYTELEMPDPAEREATAYYTDLSSLARIQANQMRADMDERLGLDPNRFEIAAQPLPESEAEREAVPSPSIKDRLAAAVERVATPTTQARRDHDAGKSIDYER